MLLSPPLELRRTLGPCHFSSCCIDHLSHFWLYRYRRFALTCREKNWLSLTGKALADTEFTNSSLSECGNVEVLTPYFVYGNHSSSFLGIAWHMKVQKERCVIPVKHGLHFCGAVLPLRDPYRKFCLWNTRSSRCYLQQNSRCPQGTHPFSRRLHILAMGVAAGSSARDAPVWIWSAALPLRSGLGEWAEAALLLTVLGESAVKMGSFYILEAVTERNTMCIWEYLCYYFI